jgi:hypothetical protein
LIGIGKEYEVAVFGELGGLVTAMGNKKLEDLDFSAYDQQFNLTNITASWDAAPGSGIYYPLIDYGTYSTDKHNWEYRTFRPALYVKEFIDKIFVASGYTYNCPLFNTTRFKRLIIPHSQKLLTKMTNLIATALIGPSSTLVDSATAPTVYGGSIAYFSYTGGLFTRSADNKTFTYTGTTPTTIHMKWHVDGFYKASGNLFLRIYIRRNGALLFWDNRSMFGDGTTNLIPFSRDYSDILVDLAPNDTLDFFGDVTVQSAGTEVFHLEVNNSTFEIRTDDAVASPIIAGDTIVINDALPKNILQKDFFSSILKLFNLYVYEDKFNEHKLNITPYVDYYDTNSANAIDWSMKLNRDKPIRIKPLSELNSRYYEFKFKADSDFYNEEYRKRYNENYGDRIYDSEFEFANESNSAELIFSGTPLIGYQLEDKVYSTIFKKSGTTEENIDSNIRILQSKKIACNSYDVKNGTATMATLTNYGYAGHLDDPNAPANDINFGAPKELYFALVTGGLNVNQFNVYWSPYMAEITDKDSRLLTASFRLNAADIYNLDFSKLVYLDGSLFRLVKIEDYNASAEDECTVTLLKVIQTIY